MGKKSRDALTQLGYGMGYFHYYRNLLADSLNLAHRKVSEIYSEYTEDQQECISIMLELDMINNSVMYCMDFATVLLSIQRPDKGLIRMISSIHETGSGSIKEFYDNVNDQPFEYFWNIMGYEKRKINKNDLPRYRRSCNRFIDDIRKMSEFFFKILSYFFML